MSTSDAAESSRANVPDAIMETLRQRIFRGEIAPGQRLPPERELAKQFGTNRTSLREALRGLEAQGLVRARQGDGVRVQDFRRHGDISLLPEYFAVVQPGEKLQIITELMHLRNLLVPEVTALCVDNGTDEHFRELQRLHQELAAADKRQDIPTLAQVELGLYRVMVEAGGSLTYLWVFNSLEKVVRGFLQAQPQMFIVIPGYVEMWGAIVDAVVARKKDEALASFHKLLDTIEKQVMQLFSMFKQASST